MAAPRNCPTCSPRACVGWTDAKGRPVKPSVGERIKTLRTALELTRGHLEDRPRHFYRFYLGRVERDTLCAAPWLIEIAAGFHLSVRALAAYIAGRASLEATLKRMRSPKDVRFTKRIKRALATLTERKV